MRKIRQIQVLVFISALLYVFSWIAVPIHLQSLEHRGWFDLSAPNPCRTTGTRAIISFPDAASNDAGDSWKISQQDRVFSHDRNHCPICSLAHNKIIYYSFESRIGVTALELFASCQVTLDPVHSAIVESIRAPPITAIIS